MAPQKRARVLVATENTMPHNNANGLQLKKATKRKADASPVRTESNVKRSALGNLTNANVIAMAVDKENMGLRKRQPPLMPAPVMPVKKEHLKVSVTLDKNVFSSVTNTKNAKTMAVDVQAAVAAAPRRTKVLTRAAARAALPELPGNTVLQTVDVVQLQIADKNRRRISNEFDNTKIDDDTLYMSALESCTSESDRLSLNSYASTSRRSNASTSRRSSDGNDLCDDSKASMSQLGHHDQSLANHDWIVTTRPPSGVHDFDKENWDDPFQASHYAMDIFNYLKQREAAFPVRSYINDQVYISRWMRSLLIDWMVEVQETFELNHETLYLAVKVVDQYLSKKLVVKDKLQLLGAGAMFLACKFDERTPPLIDDFLYICDGAYSQKELISMEMDVFRTIDYNLGIPLSYRFLRRYARCAKTPMSILTLARFILEFSLMDYATVTLRDSQLASAALYIALRMNSEPPWTPTLEYYTGYKLNEIASVITLMNNNLHQKPRDAIKTIRNKYSHKIFFEVAKIPLVSSDRLFIKWENMGLFDLPNP